MKYIKKYENKEEIFLTPYQMYVDTTRENVICYIGDNGTTYPLLCLVFSVNHFGIYEFVDWVKWLQHKFRLLNIDIRDYILKEDIVSKTIKSVEKKNFSSGPSGIDDKLIKELKKYILSDDRILAQIAAEKYNL